jgi:hypothetical protein
MRARGLAMVVAAVVGILVTVFDAVDDGFSVWNLISIVCFGIVLLYGISYLSSSRR